MGSAPHRNIIRFRLLVHDTSRSINRSKLRDRASLPGLTIAHTSQSLDQARAFHWDFYFLASTSNRYRSGSLITRYSPAVRASSSNGSRATNTTSVRARAASMRSNHGLSGLSHCDISGSGTLETIGWAYPKTTKRPLQPVGPTWQWLNEARS